MAQINKQLRQEEHQQRKMSRCRGRSSCTVTMTPRLVCSSVRSSKKKAVFFEWTFSYEVSIVLRSPSCLEEIKKLACPRTIDCVLMYVIIFEGTRKSGIFKIVEDFNETWGDKYLSDKKQLGVVQNMQQNTSSIVIDVGISYDASFQQVETGTQTGLFGVPLSEPKEMTQYWNCHMHKVSVTDMKGEVVRERVKRLHKKRAELVNLEMLSPLYTYTYIYIYI